MSPVSLSTGIVTDDADELLAFYSAGLGFEVESVSEFPQGTVHRLRRDEAKCKIYVPTGGARRVDPPNPWFRDRGFNYASLHVDDVASTATRATDAGATVLTEVTEHRSGAAFALIADPQGNVWELLQET